MTIISFATPTEVTAAMANITGWDRLRVVAFQTATGFDLHVPDDLVPSIVLPEPQP